MKAYILLAVMCLCWIGLCTLLIIPFIEPVNTIEVQDEEYIEQYIIDHEVSMRKQTREMRRQTREEIRWKGAWNRRLR